MKNSINFVLPGVLLVFLSACGGGETVSYMVDSFEVKPKNALKVAVDPASQRPNKEVVVYSIGGIPEVVPKDDSTGAKIQIESDGEAVFADEGWVFTYFGTPPTKVIKKYKFVMPEAPVVVNVSAREEGFSDPRLLTSLKALGAGSAVIWQDNSPTDTVHDNITPAGYSGGDFTVEIVKSEYAATVEYLIDSASAFAPLPPAGTVTIPSMNDGESRTLRIDGTLINGTRQVYKYIFVRSDGGAPLPLSGDNTLSDIIVWGADDSKLPLDPLFDAASASYTVNAGTSFCVFLQLKKSNAGASMKLDGNAVEHDVNTPLNLSEGANTFSIAVTPESGGAAKTYSLTVNRVPSGNFVLQALVIGLEPARADTEGKTYSNYDAFTLDDTKTGSPITYDLTAANYPPIPSGTAIWFTPVKSVSTSKIYMKKPGEAAFTLINQSASRQTVSGLSTGLNTVEFEVRTAQGTVITRYIVKVYGE